MPGAYSYWVYLMVKTPSLTLAELADLLGIKPAYGSHDKGTPRPGKKEQVWEWASCKIASDVPEEAPLPDHLESLFAKLPLSTFTGALELPADCELWLNVGVSFETSQVIFASVDLPASWIDRLASTGINISFTLYPDTGQTPEDEIAKAPNA
jgi:hypothetical protein